MGMLRNKKLLILGGGQWKEAISQFAEAEGIEVIAAGNDPHSGIFSIANRGHVVNSTDAQAVADVVRKEGIDGVYLGGSEPVIGAAVDYLPPLGMPVYCTPDQWGILQNKRRFKSACEEHGLPVVAEHVCVDGSYDLGPEDYPVLVKPADSSASRGITVCQCERDLPAAIERARTTSPTGDVLVEDYVNNKDSCIVCYSFADGEPVFCGVADKYVAEYEPYKTCVGGLMVFDSDRTDEFRSRYERRLKAMFASLGMREGNFWAEVFRDGEDYYFDEAGYRHEGSMTMYPISYLRGIDQVASEIHFSLTGRGDLQAGGSLFGDRVPRKRRYGIYSVFSAPGRVARVEGFEDLMNLDDVVYVCVRRSVGQTIPDEGSFNNVFALVHFVFDSAEECAQTIDAIHDLVSIRDDDGAELVDRRIDFRVSGESWTVTQR